MSGNDFVWGKNDTSVSVDDSQANYLDVDGFGRSKT